MSSVLDGNKGQYDPNLRILYVPEGISWDTMFDHGVKLIRAGYSVRMHEHRVTEPCSADGVVRRCGQLTDADGGARLVPDSSKTGDNN